MHQQFFSHGNLYGEPFPAAEVFALPAIGSDHSPLLLTTTATPPRRRRGFIFESYWLQEPECRSVISTVGVGPNLRTATAKSMHCSTNFKSVLCANYICYVAHLESQERFCLPPKIPEPRSHRSFCSGPRPLLLSLSSVDSMQLLLIPGFDRLERLFLAVPLWICLGALRLLVCLKSILMHLPHGNG